MTRWRVLIGSRSFGKAAPEHIAQLETAGCEVIPNGLGRAYREEELMVALRDVDAIITGTDELTARVIRSTDRLKTIAKHGVGVDNIDLAAARGRHIVVTTTPGAIHDSVADLTLSLILAVARRIVSADASVHAGEWKRYTGFELREKTLGLVGFGRIGKEVAKRAQGFGMRVIASDPCPDTEYAAAHDVEFLPLNALLAGADVVSLHAAGPPDRPLLRAVELTTMKPNAVLINTARGHLVDEAALANLLREGKLAGAGLDVFVEEPPRATPLLDLPNVVMTPHLGGQTHEGLRRMGQMTLENCLRALRNEQPISEV